MSAELPPPPLGATWNVWAESLNKFLTKSRDQLRSLTSGDSAAVDGVLMWDREGPYPVVSLDGEWRQIVVANGYAFLFQDANITAAASNTAYPIVFDTPAAGYAEGISLGASPNQSRIIFEEGGLYSLNFTAQIYSTSSSKRTFWFWPRINGVDVPSGATTATLHDNQQTKPVTKGAIFSVEADDYLEAMWATDSHTDTSLEAFAATAFAPATPSVSLSISRVQA